MKALPLGSAAYTDFTSRFLLEIPIEDAFGLLMSLDMLIEVGEPFDLAEPVSGRGVRKPGLIATKFLPCTSVQAAIAHK
jgi:hypothetical protein